MPYWAESPGEPFLSFERGINRDQPPTMIDRGYYEDAENVLLYSDTSGRHASTVKLDVELDSAVTWPDGQVYWFSPYTYSSYDTVAGVLTSNTHLLIHRSTGAFYRYDAGSPGTNTLVRRLDSAAQLTTHFVYDEWLNVLNGRDAPLKYGQHFLWDGQAEARPYLFPLGSKPISPLDPSVTGETINLSGAGSAGVAEWITDAASPDGGARVGSHSLKIPAATAVDITFSAARDFLAGPRPYGGTDFAATDSLVIQYNKTAEGGLVAGATTRLRVAFGTSAGADFRFFDIAPSTVTGVWTTATTLRSAATSSGSPNWESVTHVSLHNNDDTNDIWLDDLYFLYANAPPAAQVGTAHKERVVLGGVPVTGTNNDPALSTLFYSLSAKPDEYPAANTQIISGGATSLARTNRITALREYGDAVIIGTQNAIFSWTIGTSGDPSKSVITTETGIDSQRAIIETPSGSLLFPWQRGFYVLRQTGRSYVSQAVAPILKDIWLEEPWWTMGIRDEKTKSIRFWFREKLTTAVSDPQTTTQGLIFDYVRSQEIGESVWPATMSQLADFAAEAYVNGTRETLYCRFDDQQIYRLHIEEGGTLVSYVTLPWLALQGRDKRTRWVGLSVPYASKVDVRVFVRYASNPGEFLNAQFEEVDMLPASPEIGVQGRVMLGRPARWAQVKFQAQEYGFELFPPIEFIAQPMLSQP